MQVKIDEEETSNIRDQLLPLIIGLLRTVSIYLLLLRVIWVLYRRECVTLQVWMIYDNKFEKGSANYK